LYRQFHNYDDVIFLYCHIFDSNYCLTIDTETFLFGFIHFRWTGFYRPYSIFNFSIFVTDRIKTYMNVNSERIFLTVSDRFHPYGERASLTALACGLNAPAPVPFSCMPGFMRPLLGPFSHARHHVSPPARDRRLSSRTRPPALKQQDEATNSCTYRCSRVKQDERLAFALLASS
jgi:hypothetical protein